MKKTVIDARGSTERRLGELWAYRHLLFIFCWRELKVRYKQTLIGVAWVVLRPLITVLVLSFIFHRVAGLDAGPVPYPLFVLTGMLAWQFFAVAFAQAAGSLIVDRNIITKVYFPRLLLPLSNILVAGVDFGVVFLLLLIYAGYSGVALTGSLFALPLFFGWLVLLTAGAALLFAALNARYRDFRYIVPIVLQLGFYLSPVGFAATAVPAEYLPYFGINPMVGIIGGFRWSILGGPFPGSASLLYGALVTAGLVWLGWATFRRTERQLSDIL